ncbi:MAG: 3-oxoacyl-[acyl-carrier-protein] synthase-3, partial [Kiritimatiellia bacterium]
MIIRAAGVSRPDPSLNSIEHSVRAGLDCLQRAGLTVHDVDILVNVGVYRHHNMCEPAVCAIIQHELRMCLNPMTHPVDKTVFSFDLNNGACGVLSALQVVGAVLPTRGLDHALIVGADCHPSGAETPHFPITPMGAALLLSRSDGPTGLQAIWQRTSTEALDGQRGACDIEEHGVASRNIIDIVRSPNFVPKLQAFTAKVVDDYLDHHSIERAGLRLICSEPSANFARQLAADLGLDDGAAI